MQESTFTVEALKIERLFNKKSIDFEQLVYRRKLLLQQYLRELDRKVQTNNHIIDEVAKSDSAESFVLNTIKLG